MDRIFLGKGADLEVTAHWQEGECQVVLLL